MTKRKPPDQKKPGYRQPPHVPTQENREKVGLLSAFGVTEVGIAAELGISHVTLRKYYMDEIATGTDRAVARVGAKLYNTAIGNSPGSITAAIFFLKVKGGWQEKIALTNSDGTDILAGIEHATDEQLKKLEEIYAEIAKAAGTVVRNNGSAADTGRARRAANSR